MYFLFDDSVFVEVLHLVFDEIVENLDSDLLVGANLKLHPQLVVVKGYYCGILVEYRLQY